MGASLAAPFHRRAAARPGQSLCVIRGEEGRKLAELVSAEWKAGVSGLATRERGLSDSLSDVSSEMSDRVLSIDEIATASVATKRWSVEGDE